MPALHCYTALLESSRWLRLLVSPRKNPFLSVVRDKLDKLHRQPEETKHFPQTSPKKHKIPNGRGRSGCFTGPWSVKMAWRIWWVTAYPYALVAPLRMFQTVPPAAGNPSSNYSCSSKWEFKELSDFTENWPQIGDMVNTSSLEIDNLSSLSGAANSQRGALSLWASDIMTSWHPFWSRWHHPCKTANNNMPAKLSFNTICLTFP